jgi:hypothetical protein
MHCATALASSSGRDCRAGRDVCDGFEIGVDIDQLLKGGARFYDKRPMARKMWATIMNALKTCGALPKQEAA